MSKLKSSTLKSILASASVAAITLGSSSAFAATLTTNVGNNVAYTNNAGNWNPAALPGAGDNLVLGSASADITLNSGGDRAFGTFGFGAFGNVNRSLGIGDTSSYSFTDMVNGGANITVNANFMAAGSLTIGNTRAAIYDVQFIHADGTLTVTTGNIHDVTGSDGENIGTLNINGTTTVGGKIGNGAANPVKQVNVGNGAALSVTGATNSVGVSIAGTGNLTANGGLRAAKVAFGTSNSTLTLTAGQTLNVTTGTTGAGVITAGGNVTFIGNYGSLTESKAGTNTLTSITLAGNATLGSGGNGATIVTDRISDGGSLTLTVAENSFITTTGAKGIGANALASIVINNTKTLTLGAGTIVYSTIDAANADNGTLVISSGVEGGFVSLNGEVGQTNALAQITVNQGVTLYLGESVKATNTTLSGIINTTLLIESNITFGEDSGVLYANDGSLIIGNINFANKGAYINFSNSAATITGNIDGDSANANSNGNIAVIGAANGVPANVGTVTGSIGTNGAIGNVYIGFNSSNSAVANTTRATLAVSGNVNVTSLKFAGSTSTLTASGSSVKISSTTGAGNILLNRADSINFSGNVGSASTPLTSFQWDNGTARLLNISNATKIYANTIGGTHAGSTLKVYSDLTLGGTVNANANTSFGDEVTLSLADGTVYNSTIDGGGHGSLVVLAPAIEPATGVILNSPVGVGSSMNTIIIQNGARLTANANVSVNDGVTFLGTGLFNLGENTLTGSVNLVAGSVLSVAGIGNVTGAVTNNGVNRGTVTRAGGNTGAIGVEGSRLFSINLSGDVAVNQNIFASVINITGGTTTVNANIGSNAANSEASVFLSNGAGLSVSAGKQVSGPVSGNGSLTIAGDPSTSVIGAINIAGSLYLNSAGSITNYVSTTSLVNLSHDLTVANGGNFTALCVCIAGDKTFTADTGSTVTITDARGIYGDGTYQPNQGGKLPQLGSAGNILAQAFPNPAGKNQTYQASGDYYITKFYIGTNAILDTSTSGLNLNGGLALAGGATLTLGSQTLSVTGNSQVLGLIFVNTTADANGNLGNIASGGGTQLTGKDIIVNITNKTVLPDGTKNLFSKVDGKANVTITGGGLNTFTYNADGTVTIGQNHAAAAAAASSLTSSGHSGAATIVSNAQALSDAASFAAEVANAFEEGESEIVDLLSSSVEEILDSAASSMSSGLVQKTTEAVSSRLSIQAPSASTSVTKKSKAGTSSGQEDNREYGVWTQGFVGLAKQKTKGMSVGYKTNYYGGLVGIDTPISETDIVGGALLYSDSVLKTANKGYANKAKSKSAILSLYGIHDFSNNWYVSAIGAFGNSWIISKNKKYSNGVGSVSTGKYSSRFASLDVGAEYHYDITESINFIPEARLRVLVSKNQNYKEKGGAYNRTVKSKTGATFEGVLGALISTRTEYKNHEIMPSLHSRLFQHLGGKNQKISVNLDGLQVPISTKAKPRNKTIFNIGGDLNVKSRMIEYGVGYDIDLAKKYMAQTGTLKLRVNL